MTLPKILILLLSIILFSCRNGPTDTTEARTLYTSKSIDTIKHNAFVEPVDTTLFKIWTAFQQAVSTNNISHFKQLSLDSLYCCDTILSTSNFLKICYKDVFDTLLLRKIVRSAEINQIDEEMELGYFTKSVLSKADFTGEAITLKQFQVVKELTPDGAWTIAFDFIKTRNGYKLFGCNSYGGPKCCR